MLFTQWATYQEVMASIMGLPREAAAAIDVLQDDVTYGNANMFPAFCCEQSVPVK